MNHVQTAACLVGQVVNVVEREADLARDVSDHRGRQLSTGGPHRPQHARQRRSLDVLHRQEQHAVVLAELVHLHDVRVVQAAQDLRFVSEHPNELGITPVRRKDAFDDDVAREASGTGDPGLEDLGHAADAQGRHQLVPPELDAALATERAPELACRLLHDSPK